MMSSVPRVKFSKIKDIFRYHTKGVTNQVSSNLDFIRVQISVLKWGKKRKSGKTFSVLQNGVIRGLQIGACFREYKSGQEGFQIGAKRLQIGAKI